MKSTKQQALQLTRTSSFSFRVFFKNILITLTKAFFGTSESAKQLVHTMDNNTAALKMMIIVNLSLFVPIILLIILFF